MSSSSNLQNDRTRLEENHEQQQQQQQHQHQHQNEETLVVQVLESSSTEESYQPDLEGNNNNNISNNNNNNNNNNRSNIHRGHSRNNQSSTVESVFVNGRLPPVNRIVRHFKGTLLEITRHEAHEMCQVLEDSIHVLDKLHHFEDVNSYQSHNAYRVKRVLIPLPHTNTLVRYFVAPELCVNGNIGLVLVDAVRVLFVIEKEMTGKYDYIDQIKSRYIY